ncbi:hypothetical protein B0H10DRAFT_2221118 [Mycena sp. CBHHK59/15]|nr:hypothetical protein B0H10DRAFT_2221118 [Mycena sp. CBHHK59/15]
MSPVNFSSQYAPEDSKGAVKQSLRPSSFKLSGEPHSNRPGCAAVPGVLVYGNPDNTTAGKPNNGTQEKPSGSK